MPEITRRAAIAGLSGLTAATALPAFAQRRPRGLSFVFDIDGTRFGAVATVGPRGLILLTVRAMNNRFRGALMINRPQPGAGPVTVSGAGREVTVSDAGNAPRVAGRGITLIGFAPHPGDGGGQPQPYGLLGNIINAIGDTLGAIGDLLEVIGVGIAAGLAWLVGAEFNIRFWDGRGEIWVDPDGSFIIGFDGSGFMPPPPETEEDPGVWY